PILIAPNGSAPVSGWITNNGASAVDLLGLMVNLSHSGITWDDDAFVSTFPATLGAGETVYGTFLTAYADAGATPGDYGGSVYVYGDPEDSNEVMFTLRLEGAIVPESGTLASLIGMVGLGGFGILRRRLDRRAR
ncbi:MAG: PEP-CTERM sorting domain-containing protein, partial [Chthonomonadales bacterium]|nr:PEP-CTERM sorting domain-containing protein [Chthonomonadales bacterium]